MKGATFRSRYLASSSSLVPSLIHEEYFIMIEKNHETRERVVCDYIAGMSDRFAIDLFEELFVPKAWKG